MRSFALAVAVAAPAAANGSSITAVQKVIQLLNDMRTKAQQDMNDEQVEFSKFNQFCKDETANKKKAIAAAEELMEELSTEIEKLGSDIDQLADEIDQLQQDTTTNEAQLKEQTLQREKDKASNTENIQDLSESVDALDRAVKTLEARSGDVKQAGAALLQVSTMTDIPDSVQRSIAAFIEMSAEGPQANFNDGGEEQLSYEAPEANAYESQSGGILDLLKKLKKEFTEKKSEAEKAEMNSQGAFNMIVQDLHDQIEANTKDVSDKSETKEQKTEQKADDSKRLESTTADHAEDSETLKQLDTECFEKKDSFDEKQQLRKEEIVAIGKAVEIMQSPDVAGNAEQHLPTFIQKGTALAQLRSKSSSPEDNSIQVVNFIKTEEGA
jgi:chromosome segregation ATPase